MSPLPAAASYAPYYEVTGQPHIVVDGKAQDGTTLTLSHWPWNNTPEVLRRDTSTDIAFAYLHEPSLHQDVSPVTNSHYDEDGLLSMFALIDPELAREHENLCIATSYATDFWRCTDESAAKLACVLGFWSDAELSPLGAELFALPLRERIVAQYRGMLDAIDGILTGSPDESQWRAEFVFWQTSREQVAAGKVAIEEHAELDLAIVQIPADFVDYTICRYLQRWSLPVHPFAVFEQTNCSRVLWVHGGRIWFQYRYESWVQIASFRPQPRVDLEPLALRLTELEPGSARWQFEGVHEVAAQLATESSRETGLSSATVIAELTAFLRSAPPAWDPYGEPPEWS